MRKRVAWATLAFVVVAGVAALASRGIGFSARRQSWPLEESVMRGARRWATPPEIRTRVNPAAANAEAVRAGLEHWADHCATCHGNDGSGDTSLGRNLYPPAPDMRERRTQGMTDGELFYVVETGIPFTGMPAWGTGSPEGEMSSWQLVAFIRHLPKLTDEELKDMEALNPTSAAQQKRRMEIDEFLSGK